MFRLDRNCFHGELCKYVKGNIASKQLHLHTDIEIEAIYLEINICLKNGLLCIYTSPPTYQKIIQYI